MRICQEKRWDEIIRQAQISAAEKTLKAVKKLIETPGYEYLDIDDLEELTPEKILGESND